MRSTPYWGRLAAAASLLFLAACQDSTTNPTPPAAAELAAPASPQALAAAFARVSPEVMALPQTVFAARDEAAGQLVFGVEHPGVTVAVQNVMARSGMPASAYRVEVTEPIRFLNTTLRTEHRPTMGGLQIQFSRYICTLGFSVVHDAGRSFFTNSHCTDKQGEESGTVYYQPASSVNSSPIGVEAHDPAYLKGALPGCSLNKRCRYSDAARVLYQGDVPSVARIAKTTGVNTGSLDVGGSFAVTKQSAATSFSGTLHKVGRTTGWTSGETNASKSCVTVNVSGSNIQLLCQTLVDNDGSTTISAGGDSGSPVFIKQPGSDDVELVGILWGGSGTSRFVFSPLANFERDGLGSFNATTDGGTPPSEPKVGTIKGTVTAASGGAGISGATVAVDGTTLSATTDGSGGYSINGVPVATYSVTASASGYVSETKTAVQVTDGGSVTANFALAAVSGPDPDPTGTVHVASIGYSTSGGRLADRHLTVTVRLEDGADAPVSGASVSIELKRDGGAYGTASGTTGSNGTVSFSFNNYPSGTYTTVVTSVSAGTLTWDVVTPDNGHTKP